MYPIRIHFWLKSYYPYLKTIRKYDAQHTFLWGVYFALRLQLNMIR